MAAVWTNLTQRRRIALGDTYIELRPTGPGGRDEVYYKCQWAGTGNHCGRAEPARQFHRLESHESYSRAQRMAGLPMLDCPGERLD